MSPAPDGQPFVSVIVPFYGAGIDALDRCVAAIAAQDYPADRFELIVIDNNRLPVVAARYAQMAQPPRIVHEPMPAQFRARNAGIAAARGEALAFTDADCQPAAAWLRLGVAMLVADRGCGLVAGKVVMTFRDPLRPGLFEAADACFHLRQEAYVRDYHFCVTANLLTWKSVIDSVGAFDAALISQGDGEWGQRVWQRGYRQYYAPDAVVFHPARSTLRATMVKTRRLFGAEFRREGARGLSQLFAYQLDYHRVMRRSVAERWRDFGRLRTAGIYGVLALLAAARGVELVRLLVGAQPERR